MLRSAALLSLLAASACATATAPSAPVDQAQVDRLEPELLADHGFPATAAALLIAPLLDSDDIGGTAMLHAVGLLVELAPRIPDTSYIPKFINRRYNQGFINLSPSALVRVNYYTAINALRAELFLDATEFLAAIPEHQRHLVAEPDDISAALHRLRSLTDPSRPNPQIQKEVLALLGAPPLDEAEAKVRAQIDRERDALASTRLTAADQAQAVQAIQRVYLE